MLTDDMLGQTNVKGAHFIQEDVGLFDAAFFNFPGETAAVRFMADPVAKKSI